MPRVNPDVESESGLDGTTYMDTTFDPDSRDENQWDDCCRADPVTPLGRKLQLTYTLLVALIPIAILIFHNAQAMFTIQLRKKDLLSAVEQINLAAQYGKLITTLQMERAETTYGIFNNGTSFSRENITARFASTDEALDSLPRWPTFRDIDARLFNSKLRFRIRLEDWREKLMTYYGSMSELESAKSVIKVIKWYSYANEGLLSQLDYVIVGTRTSGVWSRQLIAYKSVLRALENVGICIVYGVHYYGRGYLTHQYHREFVYYDSLGEGFLNTTIIFARTTKNRLEELFVELFESYGEFKHSLLQRRREILRNVPHNGSKHQADEYYNTMTDYLTKMRDIQLRLRHHIMEEILQEIGNVYKEQTISLAILIIVFSISPIFIFVLVRSTYRIQDFAMATVEKSLQLRREKEKADNILYNLIPRSLISQVKRNKKWTPSESFECISIVKGEIVHFTQFRLEVSPQHMMITLNLLNDLIDSRVGRYDVYKSETTGSGFTISSGLPHRNGNRHASEIGKLALDLHRLFECFSVPHIPNKKLEVRMGLHSGPCVAGIVGTRLPRYSVFGKATVIADRLLQTSEPMKIQVSSTAKTFLDTFDIFTTENAGLKEFKLSEGTQKIQTYWLVGRTDITNSASEVEYNEQKLLAKYAWDQSFML